MSTADKLVEQTYSLALVTVFLNEKGLYLEFMEWQGAKMKDMLVMANQIEGIKKDILN